MSTSKEINEFGPMNVNANFFDDRTTSFFWRPHSLMALVLLLGYVIYEAFNEYPDMDNDTRTKRGLIVAAVVYLVMVINAFRDGPFIRPHPVLWRAVMGFTLLYELVIVFLLFQTPGEGRHLLTHIDPSLGRELPERTYAEDCTFFDFNKPWYLSDSVLDKMDFFVFAHVAGWIVKTLILRDYWLCWTISILFEVMEYSLETQLPNFSECAWDHFILDIAICNALGIWIGMQICHALEMKRYEWRGLWQQPDVKSKLSRMAGQFTPYIWEHFDWQPTASLKKWLGMVCVIAAFTLAEINAFFMKAVLWIPSSHWINFVRAVLIYVMGGACGIRETHEYFSNPNCKRFGQQAWIILAIVTTETLVCLKYGKETISTEIPSHVKQFWAVATFVFVVYTLGNFMLFKKPQETELSYAPSSNESKSVGENCD